MHIISHQLLPAHRRHAEALGTGRSTQGVAVLWVAGIGYRGGDGIRELREVTGHAAHQGGAVLLRVVGDAASGCGRSVKKGLQDENLPAVPLPRGGKPGLAGDDVVSGVKDIVHVIERLA